MFAGVENVGNSWSKNGIKWRKVLDMPHGFTHVKLKGQPEVEREEATTKTYAEIREWLQLEVFA